MQKSLALIIIILSLVACNSTKKFDPNNDPNKRPYVDGMEEPKSKMLTSPEVQIGQRICSLLETKNKMLTTYANNHKMQLVFVGNVRACGNANEHIKNGQFNVYVDRAGLDYEFFAPTRSEYFRDVITKDSVTLEAICDALTLPGEVSRQYAIRSSNIVVKFLVKDSMDRVEITQSSPAINGGYKFENVEGISFISTTKHGPRELFGLEKERSRFTSCPNSDMPSYLKQNFIGQETIP